MLTVALTLMSLAPLVGTGGHAVLLDWLVNNDGVDQALSPAAMLLPLAWIIPAAFVAAGYGVHRDWPEVIDRLGLRWPGWPQIRVGALLGLALIPAALAVRGLLQPRLGLLLSNALFASLHAWQYTADGVLLVFLLGTGFGLLRRRTNTVVAIVAHALYDFVFVILILWGVVS